jgi:hypothetical protein
MQCAAARSQLGKNRAIRPGIFVEAGRNGKGNLPACPGGAFSARHVAPIAGLSILTA